MYMGVSMESQPRCTKIFSDFHRRGWRFFHRLYSSRIFCCILTFLCCGWCDDRKALYQTLNIFDFKKTKIRWKRSVFRSFDHRNLIYVQDKYTKNCISYCKIFIIQISVLLQLFIL